MPTRRKKFRCGHRGFGAYCHRCAQGLGSNSGNAARRKKGLSASDAAGRERTECLGVDLCILPHAALRKKAENALLGIIRDGQPYTAFSGKRMGYDRRVISVPIGRGWRLLLKEREDKSKVVLSLLSHESYNRARPR